MPPGVPWGARVPVAWDALPRVGWRFGPPARGQGPRTVAGGGRKPFLQAVAVAGLGPGVRVFGVKVSLPCRHQA